MISTPSSDQDYTLKMEDREGYLYALAAGGKLTAQISAAYWNEIAGRCFENNVDRILIEKDFAEAVGPEDMLLMADHLGNLLPGRRVAFVDRHQHASINELGKKLARNRHVMLQLFDSVMAAEKWLRAN
ncbi:MAG TPA: hypothetical protein PLK77_09450 [Pyrinomonadaceae bacterium]|nr:hypothetical protein [Pyrinomonadaceae bacterium]